jgi:DNA-binding GntR family transcriptional regulator
MAPRKSPKKLSASERVEEYVRQAIYRGSLKPRERLIEEEVAQQLRCSRGPVREALLRLQRDGLIVTVARRGTFIRDISTESIEVIFSMRGKLEALCVRYLRQQICPESENLLRSVLKQMKKAASKNDNELFLQADMKLHQTIWQLSNREQVQRTLNTIMNPFIFMFARAYSAQTPISQRYKEHAQYVDTVLNAPISKVEQLVEQYFRKLADDILEQIPQVPSISVPVKQDELYASLIGSR